MHHDMQTFRDVAARYGVDPQDETAVEHFLSDTVPTFAPEEQAAIFNEILGFDAAAAFPEG